MAKVRLWPLPLLVFAGACVDREPVVEESSATSDADPSCPEGGRHRGPFELPEGILGEWYEVRLSTDAGLGGTGFMLGGEIPKGLELDEVVLSGVLEESGEFELEVSVVQHWHPSYCPSPQPDTFAFNLVVIEPRPRDSSTSSGGTSSGGTSSGSSSGR